MSFKKILLLFGIHIATLLGMHPGDSLVVKAANAFYNFETNKAITILDSARIKYPNNPLLHFTWVAAQMLHSEANNSINDTYIIINNSLDEVIPILKKMHNKSPEDPMYNLYLGCATGLSARINLGKKLI